MDRTQPDIGSQSQMASQAERILSLIAEARFSVVYQPIVDLRSNQIVGFEALTRVDESEGFANTGELFEAAATLGVQWELEQATRQRAILCAHSWPDHIQLFINCAPEVIQHPQFAEDLFLALGTHSSRGPSQVIVEITERSPHLDMAALTDKVDALRKLGLQIAIDDVGMGASGLVRISALRPGWLKLDRALISQIDKDRFRWNLVRYLVQFAKSCGVQVIAEGIEREEEAQAVREIGVCFGQGFHLGKPTADPLALLTAPACTATTVRPAHNAQPSSLAMLRGVQAALVVDRRQSAASAAQLLLPIAEQRGVCVIDGNHLLGWVSRQDVLSHAADDKLATTPLGMLIRRCPVVESDQVEFAELFELGATHAQLKSECPIVIVQDQYPLAIITTNTLLAVAADLFRDTGSWSNSAGHRSLPSRVVCEQHLDSILANCAPLTAGMTAATLPSVRCDAAVLDLRGMGRFNRAHGFEQGDQLMSVLVDLVRTVVVAETPGVFFGHLGLDAYLLTAPSRELRPVLERLTSRFDQHVASLSPSLEDRVALRVVEILDFSLRFADSNELLRYAADRGAAAHQSGGGSSVVLDVCRAQQARA
jgi:EAL domain-containing protein (putative c-di-GMP-specific phosphodiesterase class I)/GGDEF domain-containing protein